ncbi:MAG: hypothetical protein HON55_01705 [Legionellales bacterium]|nr:hypothetical protein [Legionellales bacterium]
MNSTLEQKNLRASRLKKLRKMTNHSRKDFATKYNISPGTLQNWETARFGGLTEKGAKIMLEALDSEKIFASFEWLMYGIGESPLIQNVSYSNTIIHDKNHNQSKEEIITKELNMFLSLNKNSLHSYIEDNSMEPFYKTGALVAGRIRKASDIKSLVNRACIVITDSNEKMVRYLKPGSKDNLYNLIFLNHDTEQQISCLNDVTILEAAPISWIRYTH